MDNRIPHKINKGCRFFHFYPKNSFKNDYDFLKMLCFFQDYVEILAIFDGADVEAAQWQCPRNATFE